MKLNIFLVLTAIVSTISAADFDTNARRMARGLPPMPPARRATPVAAAKRTLPSGSYHGCDTGSLHCCDSIETYRHHNSDTALLSKLHKIPIPLDVPIGFNCSPLGIGNTCHMKTACCEDKNENVLISMECFQVL